MTRKEARKLQAELPAHLADMAAFSLSTGLRAANVTGLQWSQVDEERKLCWVHPDQAKARKAIAVPVNREALAIVQRKKGIHPTHVFSFRGKPIMQVSTKARYGALKGICAELRGELHARRSTGKAGENLTQFAPAVKHAGL